MKKYFQSCKTKQEAKKLFRELAKINHPDAGGSNDEMVAIIAEYEAMMKKLPSQKDEHSNTENQTEEEFNLHVSEELKTVINNISHLPLDIEVIGTWIWVSGINTYKYKSYLTANNFVWCPSKKMYSWHMEKAKKGYYGKPQEIEKIRFTYGSTKVNNTKQYAIR
ncbi:hypothetical protein [Paenibacillus tianjinensis]|uniref:J domain-containing protein n=1 Tax=Paenibacillus tianjinensis TaxID=2810347 RepID=A0ABX7L9V0_9BACL|nr:hypothetical protein [Paenibacillus tianjinensis]QSF43513.1 hypothetical protein JRJ22_19820 [Paenibacillus tianjinensis]